jgi:hypothetical protein
MEPSSGDTSGLYNGEDRRLRIMNIRGAITGPLRAEMLSDRVEVLCSEWAEFVCLFETQKTVSHKTLPNDMYHRYWTVTQSRRLVLLSVMNCYYNDWKLKPTVVARDMRIAKSAVTLILKEAKELGLTEVDEKSGWPHSPTQHTIKGFVYYTSWALQHSGILRMFRAYMAMRSLMPTDSNWEEIYNVGPNKAYEDFYARTQV